MRLLSIVLSVLRFVCPDRLLVLASLFLPVFRGRREGGSSLCLCFGFSG